MFNTGDVVRLKGGGPPMTVGEVQRFDPPVPSVEMRSLVPMVTVAGPSPDWASVAWFDGSQVRRATFATEMLEAAAADESGVERDTERRLLTSQKELLDALGRIAPTCRANGVV